MRAKCEVAEANWGAFARDLGPPFFEAVANKGIATPLIREPPRRPPADLRWSPEIPMPLANVDGLIVEEACCLRNSYHHGEKFVGGPEGQRDRDRTLIVEAHAVLDEAIAWSNLIKG